MSVIKRFEDIKAWQAARNLANAIYIVTNNVQFHSDHSLRNQIRRASASCMHNIAEGFDAGFNAEFIRFLRIALRSASEVQSQLYLAKDQKYIDQEEFNNIYTQAEETKKLLHGFIAYLVKEKKKKG